MSANEELSAFLAYQKSINDMLLQQNKQMQDFQEKIKQTVDERLKANGHNNGNGKFGLVSKIIIVGFSLLITIIGGVTTYYVKENDDWKKTMRADFNSLQKQVNDDTSIIKSSLARIEIVLDNRFPAKK